MRSLALAAFMILAACTMSGGGNEQAAQGPREVAPVLTGADARDTRSFARPEVARVTHVALDLDADFAGEADGGDGDARHPGGARAPRRSSSTARAWRSRASPTPAAPPCSMRWAPATRRADGR